MDFEAYILGNTPDDFLPSGTVETASDFGTLGLGGDLLLM